MANIYDYGIYRGVNHDYDYKSKDQNIRQNVLYMLTRSLQMFKYNNLPDTIPQRELERLLQTSGYAGIIEVDSELYAVNGTLSGKQNAYSRPSNLLVTNIGLGINSEYEIDSECVLIQNDDLGLGLVPIYSKYSTALVENEITMIMASIQKRTNTIFTANDDNTNESAKAYIQKLVDGDIGVVMENKLYDSFHTNSIGVNGTNLSDLIEYQQYTKASMYNEIGLKDTINMKKERLISDEVNEGQDTVYPLVDSMLYNREQAVEKINEMYGTDISVELHSSWAKAEDETELDTEIDTELETELDTELETEIETELDTELDIELDTELETEIETEIESEDETEIESEDETEDGLIEDEEVAEEMAIEEDKIQEEDERYSLDELESFSEEYILSLYETED